MKHFKWYLENDKIFKASLRILIKRLVECDNKLTPEYLLSLGWVIDDYGFYYEPGIKDKHVVFIKFLSDGYYNVYLTNEKVYFTIESTIEWFEMFSLLQHPDNGRWDIINV